MKIGLTQKITFPLLALGLFFAVPAFAYECHQTDGDIVCTDQDQTDNWATASGGGADWNLREVSPGDRWLAPSSDAQHVFVDADRCVGNNDSITYSLYHSYDDDPLGYVYSDQDANVTCVSYSPPSPGGSSMLNATDGNGIMDSVMADTRTFLTVSVLAVLGGLAILSWVFRLYFRVRRGA